MVASKIKAKLHYNFPQNSTKHWAFIRLITDLVSKPKRQRTVLENLLTKPQRRGDSEGVPGKLEIYRQRVWQRGHKELTGDHRDMGKIWQDKWELPHLVVWGIRGSEGSWWKTKNADVFRCKIGQAGERVSPPLAEHGEWILLNEAKAMQWKMLTLSLPEILQLQVSSWR